MENPIVVHEHERLHNLIGEALNLLWTERLSFFHQLFHVLLKIELHVLKHQIKLLVVEDHLL